MTERYLPISEEQLTELREPLSPKAQMTLDFMLSKLDGTEKDEEELREFADLWEDLSDEEREQISSVSEEILKAYERALQETEAFIELSERGTEDVKRAQEIDPSVNTIGEARRVLLENGITPKTTEADLEVEIELPPVPYLDGEWVKIPLSEMPTDENGIPTKAAARDGWGFQTADGTEFKLTPQETTAMRLLGEGKPYEEFINEHYDPQEVYEDYYGVLMKIKGLSEETAREAAEKLTRTRLHNTYLATLASIVKEMDNLQGYIDVCKDKDTAAARRYKEETLKTAIHEEFDRYTEELIVKGVLMWVIGEDGKEYLKLGLNHEEWAERVKAEREEGESPTQT